jgi:hypothetical protein
MTERARQHDIGVRRVDNDLSDTAGLLETHPRPGTAGIAQFEVLARVSTIRSILRRATSSCHFDCHREADRPRSFAELSSDCPRDRRILVAGACNHLNWSSAGQRPSSCRTATFKNRQTRRSTTPALTSCSSGGTAGVIRSKA